MHDHLLSSSPLQLIELLLAWLAYFAVHSLLAATRVKAWAGRRWPRLIPAYRIVYNALAVLTLIPVLWLAHDSGGGWLWQWRGAWAWLANGLAAIALFIFLAVARSYDMGEFSGLRQLAEESDGPTPQFTVGPVHRFVRHPWYSCALLLIWTRDMNAALLVSALAMTVYLFVGAWLEERKLVQVLGETYRRYQAAVPGLIPRPWKYLPADAVDKLADRPDE